MSGPNMPSSAGMPKCFGTDYYGKWNSSGMTWDSMKIDKPEQQTKCCECIFFERCYMVNNLKLLRIKR